MKCIKCGHEIDMKFEGYPIPIVLGYECLNPDCSEFGHPWDKKDHKDNQEWTIWYIHHLEQRVQTLEGLLSSMSTDLNEIKEAIQNATKT
jgi:hypothetical protein